MATEVSEQVEVVEAADSAALAVGAGRPAGQVESVAGGLSSQALVGAGLDPERMPVRIWVVGLRNWASSFGV